MTRFMPTAMMEFDAYWLTNVTSGGVTKMTMYKKPLTGYAADSPTTTVKMFGHYWFDYHQRCNGIYQRAYRSLYQQQGL
jgi:hypothetical protein